MQIFASIDKRVLTAYHSPLIRQKLIGSLAGIFWMRLPEILKELRATFFIRRKTASGSWVS